MSRRKKHDVAENALLALLLEVTSDPKPGNVDRGHDHDDTTLHDFVVSGVDVLPALREAERLGSDGDNRTGTIRERKETESEEERREDGRADPSRSLGDVFKRAVRNSNRRSNRNTHFGALLLLIPLVVASARSDADSELRYEAEKVVSRTTTEDAVSFFETFDFTDVRAGSLGDYSDKMDSEEVQDVEELDVTNPEARNKVREKDLSLSDIMKISAPVDGVAREWSTGFERSFETARLIEGFRDEHSLNTSISLAYMRLLAQEPDTLVAKKFGEEKAHEVSERAREVLESATSRGGNGVTGAIQNFDDELVSEGVNPGTTADIVSAGIFIALEKGGVEL